MRIHIGCGKKNWPGWYNVDGAFYPHIESHDVYLNHLHDDVADLIYSSHFLEYFNRDEAEEMLKFWYRVLKPGGIVRIAVPDFDALIYAYTNFVDITFKDIAGPLYGRMDMNGHTIYHKYCWTFNDLFDALFVVGFKNPRNYDFRETEHARYDDASKAHLPHDPEAIKTGVFTGKHFSISLNMEARK